MPQVPTVARAADESTTRRARRADRHRARAVLWTESSRPRVKLCGRKTVDKAGVTLRVTGTGADARAGFSGLSTCGSVWACPCCATKVLAGRQGELTRALEAWTQGGGRVGMVTLTMRHRDGQRLRTLWDGLSYAWNAVTSGDGWQALQTKHGVPTERKVTHGKRKGQTVVDNRLGWVRVVETTHGVNGWHVHVHVAVLLHADASGRDVDDLGCAMFQRWRDALVRKGLDAPLARHGGLHAKLWDGTTGVMGDYFTKNEYSADASKAALEVARGDLKQARAGNRTPFRILADVVELGVADDLALWHEWESGSAGRAQMTWSQGLRARLLPDEDEKTDEELAEAADLAGEPVAVIPGRQWGRVMYRAAELLDAAEAGTWADWLGAHGVRWKTPSEKPRCSDSP